MSYLSDIVNQSLPKANSQALVFKPKYGFDTDDIIDIIMWAHPRAVEMTKKLAQKLPGVTVYDFCKNLYTVLKENVKYIVDTPGSQHIKSPAQTWTHKFADCKSYSLFIGSVLQNRGIPFKYRFVSFKPDNPTPTHVYVIVPQKNGQYITMDVVWNGFNQEKQFNYKKDMEVEGLTYVSGIGATAPGELNLGDDIANLSEGEFDLMIAKQRMELLKNVAVSRIGIGKISNGYEAKIQVLNDALYAARMYKQGKIDEEGVDDAMDAIAHDAVNGIYDRVVLGGTKINGAYSEFKAGIGKGRLKKAFKKLASTKTGKFLKKVGKAITKPVLAVAKVLTYPQRRIMQEIMEKKLPKAAPHFLYLFIPDSEVSKFPKKIQEKRKKQGKLRKFITTVSTMKEKQFMGICRNGIIKKHGKEPEALIADMANQKAVLGIGDINADGYKDSNALIQKLFEATGKKYDGIIAVDDSPNPNDFAVKMPLIVERKVAPTEEQKQNGQTRTEGTFSVKKETTRGRQKFVRTKPVREPDEQNAAEQLYPDLEKAAPFFIYLFINDEKIFPKLPEIVRNKRSKQVELADFIVDNAKIGRSELMAIFRKGIVKELGKDPDILLQEAFTRGGIAGLGEISGIIELVLEIVNKILGLFKKKKKDAPDVSKEDTPENSDFEGTPDEDAKEIKKGLKKAIEQLEAETDDDKKSTKKDKKSKKTQKMIVEDDSETDHSSGGTSIWDSKLG